MTRRQPRTLPLTVNGRLLDRSIRHQIALQRYGASVTADVVGFLNDQVFPDLLGRLTARLDRIAETGVDRGVFTTSRYASMVSEVGAVMDDGSKRAHRMLVTAAESLARVESQWQLTIVRETVPSQIVPFLGSGIDTATLKQLASGDIMGKPMVDWWSRLAPDLQSRVDETLRVGIAQSETVGQLVQRVRGTQANDFRDGVLDVPRQNAEAIVRTTTNTVSAKARESTYESMSNVIKGVQWVSTLDTRTTPICQSRDGIVYPINQGPRPPAHWNCRSTTVPITKSWDEILGTDQGADLPASTRASMDGQVPEQLNYEEWIQQQPAAVQDMALGPARAELLRAGKVGITDMVTQRGRPLTLDELRSH